MSEISDKKSDDEEKLRDQVRTGLLQKLLAISAGQTGEIYEHLARAYQIIWNVDHNSDPEFNRAFMNSQETIVSLTQKIKDLECECRMLRQEKT
jgi:ribulose kinase